MLQLAFSFLPRVLWRCWLGSRKGIRPVKTEWWGAGMVICLERGADLHMAQLMPLPLTVSYFSKIQIGFTFLVPAYLGSPGKGPLNVCVCVCFMLQVTTNVALPTCFCINLFSFVRLGRVASTLSDGNKSSLLVAYSEGIRCCKQTNNTFITCNQTFKYLSSQKSTTNNKLQYYTTLRFTISLKLSPRFPSVPWHC